MKKKTNYSRQQRTVFPILLWLVPLLALNLGFFFISEIDLYWREIEQSDMANQEVEGISAASDFSYQFSNVCGQFGQALKAATDANFSDQNFSSFIKERADKIFRPPFPQKELFVFAQPETSGNTDLIYFDGNKIISRRAMSRIFEYLVQLNRNENIPDYLKKQNEKLLTKTLGEESNGPTIAISQRAVTSYALYQSAPNWMFWDYIKVPGKGTFGFLVLAKCLDQNRFDGMLLSLRNFRNRRIGLAAFVPLFRGYGSSVIQAPLHKSRIFKNWVGSKITPVEDNLKEWLAKGSPPPEELGNFKVFSYLGKGNTHLTTLLLPKLSRQLFPKWLSGLNLFAISTIFILLLRGMLLNQWPELKLKLRFQISFLLAATLPLSLLFIVSLGYINQYRRSVHFQTVSNLLMSIKQFDARKAQVEDEYLAAFNRLIKDVNLIDAIAEEGSFSKKAESIIKQTFENPKKLLPILCFTILDESGEGLRQYGPGNREQIDAFINSFSYPIVSYMRRQISKNSPGYALKEYSPPDVQKMATEAYRSVASRDLIEEIGRRRSYPLQRQRANNIATQVHDFIKTDQVEKHAVLVCWEDHALDAQTIKQTTDFLALNNPDFSFIHYKGSARGIEPPDDINRHIPLEALAEAKKLAETVYFKGSYSSKQTADFSLAAYPSVKYPGNIIVGISRNFNIEKDIFFRILVLTCISIFAVFVVLLIAYLSADIMLNPVTELKNSLGQISAGNLEIKIKQGGKDELGNLASEFSQMTKGLQERNRLASLLSDHAIEALSKNQTVDGILCGEKFSGVALVSDIRNFTGLCEAHSADKITDLLNEHFARMSEIISANGGHIYKFIGDAVEAVFPNDTSGIIPEERALKAAVTMILEQEHINEQRMQNRLFSYKSGVGLAWGKFFSGGTGSLDTRLDYAVLGDGLKKAAELENLSKTVTAYPIVVDNRIAEALKGEGIVFSRLGDKDAWSVNEISNVFLTELSPQTKQEKIENGKTLKIVEEQAVVISQGHSLLGYLPFLMLTILLAGLYFGIEFRNQTIVEIRQVSLAEKNLRLIEQLKSKTANRIAFENFCYDMGNNLEKSLSFFKLKNENNHLKANIDRALESLDSKGLKFKRFCAFHFDQVDNIASTSYHCESIENFGWNSEQADILKRLLNYKFMFDQKISKSELKNYLGKDIPLLLGEKIRAENLYYELFSSAIEVTIDGTDEFFFTSYLVALNPEKEIAPNAAKGETLNRKGILNEDFRIVAAFAASVEKSACNFPEVIVNGFQDQTTALAMQSEIDNSLIFSGNFPDSLKGGINNLSAKDAAFAAINFDIINLDNQRFKLWAVSKFDFDLISNHQRLIWLATILIVFFIIGRYAWREDSLLRRSLAAKLVLAFFTCAIIPLMTAFLVVDLFAIENFNARFSQEKAHLQRFIDLFEHRQTFAEPLAWKSITNFSYSSELKGAVRKVDEQSGEIKDFSSLDEIFGQFKQRMKKLRQSIANFEPRDGVIVSKNGWHYINPGQQIDHYHPDLTSHKVDMNMAKNSDFALLLVKIGQNLIGRMRRENKDTFDSNSLKGEIALKIGLQTVSAMFGENAAIKLANGVGLPLKLEIIDSVTGLIINPVDKISNPDFIVIWMLLFNNNDYLTRIAEMFTGSYSIFSFSANSYGQSLSPFNQLFDFGLFRINSWVSAANRPISTTAKILGEDYLVESRRGIQQPSMILTGIMPIAPIAESTSSASGKIFAGLLLSLLLITMLAQNVSAEILMPIKLLIQGMKEIAADNLSFRIGIDRKDELGELCSSFDVMAKGLEEKFLMGRMLSQQAMLSTLSESRSQKEDLVILYVGSPGFSSWLSMSSPADLFRDLQKQISIIAQIILDQGGDIDKIMGEKVLAVFKGDLHQAALSACRAAQKIVTAEQKGILPFPTAAGINRGLVITGVLGVGDKKDFTIIGDAVNVAARIENLAETMRYSRVLISEEVFRMLNREINAKEFGTAELKGKSNAVMVYQLDT